MRIINFTLSAAVLATALAVISGCAPRPEKAPSASIEVKGYTGREVSPLLFGFDYSDVSNAEELVKPLKIAFFRADGVTSRYGDYCRATGAEPLLQLPLKAAGAATNLIRDFIRRGYPLRYVSIGNEPGGHARLTVNEYIDNFTNISAAVKKEFPRIKIIGPGAGWNYSRMAAFLSSCRPYIDIISVHWRPSAAPDEFDSLKNFYSGIREMTDRYAPGIPLIIDEQGSPVSFLRLADNIGVSSSEPGLDSIIPDGFILSSGGKPSPEYYIYLLFSNHIKKFIIHIRKAGVTGRVYAYRDDSGNVSVFCVNGSPDSPLDISIKFNGVLGNTDMAYRFEPFSFTCLEISKDLAVKKAYTYTKAMADSGRRYIVKDF